MSAALVALKETTVIPITSLPSPLSESEGGRTIQYFDALAGSGKTFRLAKVAQQWAAQGRVVIIAMISMALIDATYERYFAGDACRTPISVVHSGNADEDDDQSVTQRLMKVFHKAHGGGGRIIMMTHAALLRMPYIQGRRACSLIVDETPCPSTAVCLPLPESQRIIDLLTADDSNVPGYNRVVATNKAAIGRLAGNKQLSSAGLRDLCGHLTSPHWRCYARTASFSEIAGGSDDEEAKSLWIFSELDASVFDGFREVVIISALFHDTMLYQSWLRDGAQWQPVGPIWKLKGAGQTHENGENLRIYYAMSPDYSKRIREMVVNDGGEMTLIESILLRVEALFTGEMFLYNINKDIADEDKWGKALLPCGFRDRGTQLSGNSHGINEYMNDWHNVAIIAALNPSPQHFAFHRARGIDGQSVKNAIYRTICYQMMLRCSLRVKGDETPKKVVVMDRATAEYLAVLFPGSQVLYLPNLSGSDDELLSAAKPIGRPQVHQTASDKQAAYRDRQRIEKRKAELRARVNGLSINQLQLVIDQDSVMLTTTRLSMLPKRNPSSALRNPYIKKKTYIRSFVTR